MENNFEGNVSALMNSLENYVSSKTIIGEPVQYNDIVVFPMADVSFGVAAGSFQKEATKNNGAGGAGARITPSAVLIIQNGTSKIVNIKEKDSLNKLIEMIPDLIGKLTERLNAKQPQEKVEVEELDVKAQAKIEEDDEPNIEDYI